MTVEGLVGRLKTQKVYAGQVQSGDILVEGTPTFIQAVAFVADRAIFVFEDGSRRVYWDYEMVSIVDRGCFK